MNYKIRFFLKCVSVMTALIAGSATCFSTPTIAHVTNHEVLSIQLDQTNDTSLISSNLLSEEGQTIIVSGGFEKLEIPVSVSYEGTMLLRDAIPTAVVLAESSDENVMKVSVDTNEIVFEKREQVVNLTLKMEETAEPDIKETDASEETDTSEETPEDTIITGEATETEDSGAEGNTTEVKEKEVPVITVGTGITEPVPGEPTAENQISGEAAPEEPAPEEPTPEEPTPEEPAPGEPTPEEPTPQEPEQEEEKSLSAEITLILGERVYSATIYINEEIEDQTAMGELQYCPSQYHPTGVLEFVNNHETETILGVFPAMTKYTIAENEYLLYSGGNIKLLPGERVKVDLSYTDLKEDLILSSGAGTSYMIAYTDVPHDFKDLSPIMIDSKGRTLPIVYQWGEIAPVVRVEQLITGKDGLQWNAVETITYKENDDGKLQIVPNKPEAGTYRIEIIWLENEITLYRLEIPFYVQYGSVDQGGIG